MQYVDSAAVADARSLAYLGYLTAIAVHMIKTKINETQQSDDDDAKKIRSVT